MFGVICLIVGRDRFRDRARNGILSQAEETDAGKPAAGETEMAWNAENDGCRCLADLCFDRGVAG